MNAKRTLASYPEPQRAELSPAPVHPTSGHPEPIAAPSLVGEPEVYEVLQEVIATLSGLNTRPISDDNSKTSAVVSPYRTQEVRQGSSLNETDKLLNATLEAEGVPEDRRKALIVKWREDIRAAKGELTKVERIAPIGWRVLTPKEQAAAIAFGKNNPWKNENGTRNGNNLFEWIFDVYHAWIPGLTQGILKSADLLLYRELQIALTNARVGMAFVPTWFQVADIDETRLLVPADKDAALIGLAPEKKEEVLAGREKQRVTKAAQRASGSLGKRDNKSAKPIRKDKLNLS